MKWFAAARKQYVDEMKFKQFTYGIWEFILHTCMHMDNP